MEEIKTPLVSVIMPVYNAEKYLREAIESILNQTFTDFEFLIFNDGSTDSSLEIINSYKDERIILAYNDKNTGYVQHLNEGIKRAKGKYIARMDADDIALPKRFEKQVAFLEKNPVYILCGSRIRCFGEVEEQVTLPIEDEEIRLKMLYITPFAHPSVMIRKSVLVDNALLYDDSVMPAEDHDLWVRLSQFGKLHNLQENLLLYRTHKQNISNQSRSKEQIANLIKAEQKYVSYFFVAFGLSQQEITLLHLMFYQRNTVNLRQIKLLIMLIKNIEIQKTKFHNIDNKKVIDLLRENFFYLCTTSTHLGLPLWWRYIKSGLTTYHSFSLNLKFFVKTLFKYQTKF